MPEMVQRLEMDLASLAGPFMVLVLSLMIGRVTLDLAANLAARAVFRAKGYRTHQTVLLKGKEAVITRIGVWSTHFLIQNGETRYEFHAVSNTKLDDQEIHLSLIHI